MGAEEALELADKLVFEATGEHLSDLKRAVFKGAWAGQTYESIADSLGYNESYIKEEGAGLCRLLSQVLQERVTKTSFRAALERFWRSHSEITTASVPLPQTDPVPSMPPSPPTVADLRGELEGNSPAVFQYDLGFIGREGAIADLNRLVNQGAKVILIHGEGGLGKTTLARRYFKTQGFDFYLELWMATETQNVAPIESVVEEWLRRDLNQDPGREFAINLERLRRQLRDANWRVGVLIDNLEPALDGQGKFVEAHRSYVDLLRVLADPAVQSVTLITSRERLYESSIQVQLYQLGGLEEAVWQQFFGSRDIDPNSPALSEMWRAYGGNAKAMQILSGAILTDFYGDIDAYWQENSNDLLIERELQDLVSSQFNRLQQVNQDAYQLLCRMACYRYQDVSSVPIDGLLCLLWDVPEERRRPIIRILQDLSLIETRKGQYWLHSVVRSKAIAALRASDEWEAVNRTAAGFWTQQVPIVKDARDALIALEAYYHYLEIEDFEAACNVIIQGRGNQDKGLPLGSSFYQLGLLQKIISVINRILSKIASDQRKMRLYNILGYTYRLMGSIGKALECHQESSKISEIFKLDRARLSTLFNIGLCKTELWELDDAKSHFNSVLTVANETPDCEEYAIYAQCCLAFIDSCLGLGKDALTTVQTAERLVSANQLTPWGKGYSLLFLGLTHKNLGNLVESTSLCQQTIGYAEDNHFTQVKAKATNCLAELYREQQEFANAISNHITAIELLDAIGAKCDLAETYYQLGLTYQRMGNLTESDRYFQNAIQLFREINAPKQVKRIQDSLIGSH
ncbi:ATP-binding protein [Oscillatoria sp. FACHB-1407]|uniref:tetratricopeptide repeat protein n=1 Tax=Oscillatoria sp. FACHB-1407 TaxID=2692847 RepID=UPI001687CCEA|nr:tetratricopeptide repeat protein [Oscillatoria sp. FACHB-1407]MBD2459910.1 ATP-binding protein [Oscillatoria sp. FACHB-1407]